MASTISSLVHLRIQDLSKIPLILIFYKAQCYTCNGVASSLQRKGTNTILKVHRKENDKILDIGIYFILLVYIYMEGQIIIIRLLLSMESEQEELVR